MRTLTNRLLVTGALLGATFLSACGGGNGTTSRFSLAITDGPIDGADAVVISFDSIELKPKKGDSLVINLDQAATINLLDYQGEVSAQLLNNAEVESGEYNWIRLGVDASASYIEVDGAQFPLVIPSGAETGLKLNRGFTLAAGGRSYFTIDFDLRKSVHQQGTGDYKLRPVLRLVNNLEVSAIKGTVADALVNNVDCSNGSNNDTGNVVYLFSGADATIDDIQGAETDPLTTATVKFNSETSAFEFSIGFVPQGEYSLAFTCEAGLDDPTQNDDIRFSAPVAITLGAEDATVEIE